MRIKSVELDTFLNTYIPNDSMDENPNGGERATQFREISFQVFEELMATHFQKIPIHVSRKNTSTPVSQKFQRNKKGFMYFVKYLIPGVKQEHFSLEFKYRKLQYKPSELEDTVKKGSSCMIWALPFCLVQMPNRNYYTIQIEIRIKRVKPPKGEPVFVSFYKPPKNLRI